MTSRCRTLNVSLSAVIKTVMLSAALAPGVLARPGVAQPCAQTDNVAIKTFLNDKAQWECLRSFERTPASGASIDLGRAIVLAYDHTSACWSAFDATWHLTDRDRPFSLDSLEPLPALDFDFDLNGRPRIWAAVGTRVIPLVVRSNSLLYAADRAGTKEAEIEGLAELQKLTALLGGSSAAALATAGSLQRPNYSVVIESYTNFMQSVQVTEQPDMRLPPPPKTQALVQLRRDLDGATTNLAGATHAWAAAIEEPSRTLSRVTNETTNVVATLQQLEAGAGPAPAQMSSGFLSDTVNAFEKLAKADSPAPRPGCVSELRALLPALQLSGKKSADAEKLAAAQRLAVLLALRPVPETCDLVPHLTEVGTWLLGARRLDPDAQKEIGLTVGRVQAYLDLTAVAAKAGDDVAAVLKKRTDLLAAATSLDAYSTRITRRCPAVNASCSIVTIPGPYATTKWSKIETGSFAIKTQSEYASAITQVRAADVSLSYDVRWYRGSLFGTGFGVTATSLKNPKFGPVCIADASGTCTTATRYIGVTDEESRWGTIALFGSLRLFQLVSRGARAWTVQPAVDIGVGLTTSEPRFFFGGSLQFFRYFRFGGGLTLQKVTRLGVGQSELLLVDGKPSPLSTVITSASDIRARQGFQGNGYLSLVIALDDLPIFKN